MRKTSGDYESIKAFLMRVGKQIFETAKNMYYVDFNNSSCKISR